MNIKKTLFNLATKAHNNSYSPYSNFKVGAAIYADDSNFYFGCNVENVSFPCGACAEAGAISSMITGGAKSIKEILIIADSKNPITPCGNCLQKIAEFSSLDTIVHLANLEEVTNSLKLNDFLPLAFNEKDLKKC